MHGDPDAPPINPLPTAVIVLALPIIAMEMVFLAGAEGFVGGAEAVGWRLDAIERFGFFDLLLAHMAETGRWSMDGMLRFVTYPFLHWGFLHMVMVLVFLLALGKMVGEVMGSLAVATIFFGSAILGALAYSLLVTDPRPLIGGYPAVYGLIGGYTFLLWTHARITGGQQHQAFSLIAVLLGIQLVFGFLFGSGLDWIAEMAGFISGFLISFVVVPGGWARVMDKLRQR